LLRRQSRLLVAVDDVSFTLRSGETLGIVGESGSGKTTLGKAILRLIQINGGGVDWKGERIETKSKSAMRPFRTKMQAVFQDPFSSLNPHLSVKQVIEEGLIVNRVGSTARERDARVRAALVDVGLDPNTLNRFPHEFSGGQRQRIATARALAPDPEFVVLDEPTSALDLSVQGQIIDLLRDLQRRLALTYLFISHDLKVVRALCHKGHRHEVGPGGGGGRHQPGHGPSKTGLHAKARPRHARGRGLTVVVFSQPQRIPR
jgi:peptide/nickel transport system ATP-binding protein